MRKFFTRVGLGLFVVLGFANAGLVVPTPDYTDLYAVGTVALGVMLVVFLVRRAIAFFSR